MSQSPVITDEIKIYAGMGVVCVQWALLEHMVLAIISATENMPLDKVYIMFGGLDMLPRINMALRLSREAKWPAALTKRIEEIRVGVQGKSGRHGLQERRNQLIHGVHKASEKPHSVSLTMVRWQGPKRTQDVSVTEVYELASQLGALAQEASSIFDAYGVWKFGPSGQKNGGKQLAKTEPAAGLKIAQDFQSIIKRLLGKS